MSVSPIVALVALGLGIVVMNNIRRGFTEIATYGFGAPTTYTMSFGSALLTVFAVVYLLDFGPSWFRLMMSAMAIFGLALVIGGLVLRPEYIPTKVKAKHGVQEHPSMG